VDPAAVDLRAYCGSEESLLGTFAIRRSLPEASTAFIAMTAHSGRTLLASASNAFDHLLLKPLDVQDILPLLPRPADRALRSPGR
jgi:hypothetical protein